MVILLEELVLPFLLLVSDLFGVHPQPGTPLFLRHIPYPLQVIFLLLTTKRKEHKLLTLSNQTYTYNIQCTCACIIETVHTYSVYTVQTAGQR